MLEVEDKGQAVLLVIGRGQVALFVGAIRRRTLARVVNPSDQVIVIIFLAHAREVSGKPAAHLIRALADRMATHAAARLEALFALLRVAHRLSGKLRVEAALPDKGGD